MNSEPFANGRGVKVPMPPVMTTAPATTTWPVLVVIRTRPSSSCDSSRACMPRRYTGSNGAACAIKPSMRLRPLTEGNPAMSRIAFSGYIALTCPPGSARASITATERPRKPA